MKKSVVILVLVIAIALAVASWFLLPARVTIQYDFEGNPSTTVPKLAAVLIPIVLAAVGTVVGLTGDEDVSKRGFVVTVVAIVIQAFSLLFGG